MLHLYSQWVVISQFSIWWWVRWVSAGELRFAGVLWLVDYWYEFGQHMATWSDSWAPALSKPPALCYTVAVLIRDVTENLITWQWMHTPHARTHTHTHTNTHTYTHTRTTHVRTHTHDTHTYTCTHTQIHNIHTHTHTPHTHKHTHIVHAYIHTHSDTHTRTHTYTCTHTHVIAYTASSQLKKQ